MNKADGAKIGIRFDLPLSGDASGLTPVPVAYRYERVPNGAITGSSQYSTSYTPAMAFDGLTTTCWIPSTTAGQWLQQQYASPVALTKLRLYIGNTSCRPSAVAVSGSVDGVSFTAVATMTVTSTSNGWEEIEFANTSAYAYWRLDFTAYSTSYLYVYDVELCRSVPIGNERAFSVTGQQYDYEPGGRLLSATYPVEAVKPKISVENAVDLSGGTKTRTTSDGISLTLGVDIRGGI